MPNDSRYTLFPNQLAVDFDLNAFYILNDFLWNLADARNGAASIRPDYTLGRLLEPLYGLYTLCIMR